MRNMLLMDAAYVSRVSKDLFNSQLDALKLRKFLEDKYGRITRSYWITPYNGEHNNNFHLWLQRYVKTEVVVYDRKPHRCRACGDEHEVERGIDVGLVVKAIEMHETYDRLLLCNGDGDLQAGLRFVRDKLGKEIVIVGTGDTISAVSTLYSEEIVDLASPDVGTSLCKD